MTKVRRSHHRIEAKTGEGMKMEKVRWYVGREYDCRGVDLGVYGEGEGGEAKTCFWGGVVGMCSLIQGHLSGALQYDCVMLLGGLA